jgi:uncharacterized protein YbaR (Trm112 family)
MADVLTELASLLRCPITGQQLHLATPEEFRSLESYNADGFLVREDGTAAYPVEKGIPSLLPESLIPIGSAPSPIS